MCTQDQASAFVFEVLDGNITATRHLVHLTNFVTVRFQSANSQGISPLLYWFGNYCLELSSKMNAESLRGLTLRHHFLLWCGEVSAELYCIRNR